LKEPILRQSLLNRRGSKGVRLPQIRSERNVDLVQRQELLETECRYARRCQVSESFDTTK
jgi:hypothetical protein